MTDNYKELEFWSRVKVKSGALTDWDLGASKTIFLVSQWPARPQMKARLQETSQALPSS